MDLYDEEAVAMIGSRVKEAVMALQAAGEPHPVVLIVPPAAPGGREILGALGAAPGAGEALFATLPKAEAVALLNDNVSPGVGDKMLGFRAISDNGFFLAVLTSTGLETHPLVFLDGRVVSLMAARLDVATGRLRLVQGGVTLVDATISW